MPSTSPSEDKTPLVTILEETEGYRFGRLFRVIEAKLRYRRRDGRMSGPITRINFERGESVAALLHDPSDDVVVLVKQLRYPVYAAMPSEDREGDGAKRAWLLEVVAGVRDSQRDMVEVANAELLEEAGYEVKSNLQYVNTIYPSPGGTSERIALFIGEVDYRERVGEGGGVSSEGEDIEVVVVPFEEAMAMVTRGDIQDAKTIILLQHLALKKSAEA